MSDGIEEDSQAKEEQEQKDESTESGSIKPVTRDFKYEVLPEDTTQYDCVMLFYGSTKYGPKDNNYTAFAAKMTTKYKNISSYMWISSLSIYGISHYRDDVKNLSDLSDNSPNDALNVATITHEFAHTMGAIDLYSNSSRETGGVTVYPFGEYSMQSADQAGHDAYHMMGFNWVNPYVLDASKDYGVDSLELTINDLHSSGDAIIVTPSWNNNDSPFDEYILVELFDTQSVNSYKVSNRMTGVRVYHVDSRLFDLNGYDLTTDTKTNCVIPFTNTYGTAAGPTNSHPVLNNYKNYDLVHQIRKNKVDGKNEKIEYITTDHAKSDNWFVKGDSFSLEKYADQFLDKGALDSGLTSLGWTFEITSLNTNEHGATATIRFNKAL